METAVILAAGIGSKMWPYSEYRPKAVIPIGAMSAIERLIIQLKRNQFKRIIIAASYLEERIYHLVDGLKGVELISVKSPKGTADTLEMVIKGINDRNLLIVYSDIVISNKKFKEFVNDYRNNQYDGLLLGSKLINQRSQDWFCANVTTEGRVTEILGHPRPHYVNYQLWGIYALPLESLRFSLRKNPGVMLNVNVGMMPPLEAELEQSLQLIVERNKKLYIHDANNEIVDMDKPWHIMQANKLVIESEVAALQKSIIPDSASIHPTAELMGHVILGKNVIIGRNVVVRGNAIIGDNTIIDNGAILDGNIVVGSNSTIKDYCRIGENSTIGSKNRIGHCAEFQGVTFDNVSFTHYGEMFGVVGSGTDIAAGVTVGILRFDDLNQTHKINNRTEIPEEFGNAVFLGDYTRTGISSQYMPGVKVGANCAIGSSVCIYDDIPSGKMVYIEQKLIRKEWGPSRYGW